MMKESPSIGTNRTGMDLSPIDKQQLIDATEATIPSMDGDAGEIADVRSEYMERGAKVGSVPPPAKLKGVASEMLDALKGGSPSMLVDKLAERLAFERTGTRLYEALITKHQMSEPLPGGPSIEDLRRIQADELRHFELVRDTILELGGDPTTVTPAADVIAVTSLGLIQVLADPRTTLLQCLEAILTAELVDNDGWSLLVRLTRGMGHPKIAAELETALVAEEEHLAKVRSWVEAGTIGLSGPGPVAKETVKGAVKNVVADVAKTVAKSVAKDTAKKGH
jgi:hypothetical protein